MAYTVPGYLAPYIVTGMIAIMVAVVFGLNRLARRGTLPQQDRAPAVWGISALLVGWFAVAFATSFTGLYSPASGPPTIQYGLLTPIVVGLLLFWTWPLLRRTLAAIPNTWLVGVQFYRVLGVIFLVLYFTGKLPGLFAWPAGGFDVLVGILAPMAATAYARSPERAAVRVRLWNLLGITDLVVAVTLGFLTSPSPLQMAAFDRPSVLIGMFPLALIPVFAVPLSILLHLASLAKLRQHDVVRYSKRTVQTGSAGHQVAG